MIQGHGNNPYAHGGKIRLDFSSNIAFNNHSAAIIAHLQTKLASATVYPDPNATALTKLLAEHHRITPQAVLVTNGSAEAFYLVAHLLAGARTAICVPAFAEYEDACVLHKHDLHFLPSGKVTDCDGRGYQSVWFGNPNNPDGAVTPAAVITELCQKNPATRFIVDQAYIHLTIRKGLDIREGAFPPNLIVIHSLTKEFAIPGLRLGYITAHPDIINTLVSMRPPWNVNALALEAGLFIMRNHARLLPDLTELHEEILFLQQALSAVGSISVLPSSCNFLLARVLKGTARQLKQRLVEDYGILIRDAANFRGLDATYFRVAAQERSSNRVLVDAIQQSMRALQPNRHG